MFLIIINPPTLQNVSFHYQNLIHYVKELFYTIYVSKSVILVRMLNGPKNANASGTSR